MSRGLRGLGALPPGPQSPLLSLLPYGSGPFLNAHFWPNLSRPFTGGAYDKISRKRYNSNVMLFQSVPQAELLKRIDLVVSHGGNNTLNETLYHGKPVIVLPVGGEQHDNASRIEFHGLGYRIDMALLSADTLSNAVEGLRKDAELNQRLKTVSNQLMESDGATASVSLIEWVMENKKPFTKKRELPLTITRDSLPLYLQD